MPFPRRRLPAVRQAAPKQREVNHLPMSFWQIPQHARVTLTRSELKETLLYHSDARILAQGHMWDIRSRSVGAGVYAVTLKKANL